MSCNRCATTAEPVAPAAGAAHIEAGWSENRDHPQQCEKCGAFLRAGGGCTRCESTSVSSDARTLAMAAPVTAGDEPPPRQFLSCGHNLPVTGDEGETVWCSHCDDWTSIGLPDDCDMEIEFGKYKGRRMSEVYRDDPGYVDWLAEKARSPEHRQTAHRLIKTTMIEPETVEIEFGKYDGWKMGDLHQADPDYVRWLAENVTRPRVQLAAARLLDEKKEAR